MNEREAREAVRHEAWLEYCQKHHLTDGNDVAMAWNRKEHVLDGFDAGYAAASEWVAINSAEDLPTEDGFYDLTFEWPDGTREVRANYYIHDKFRNGLRRNYIAWKPITTPYTGGKP